MKNLLIGLGIFIVVGAAAGCGAREKAKEAFVGATATAIKAIAESDASKVNDLVYQHAQRAAQYIKENEIKKEEEGIEFLEQWKKVLETARKAKGKPEGSLADNETLINCAIVSKAVEKSDTVMATLIMANCR